MNRWLGFAYLAYRHAGWLLRRRAPLVAALKLTMRCNLNCRHCPWTQDQTQDLSTPAWMQIMKDLSRQGVLHVVLEGGEPTLRDDLQELIVCGKQLGMRVTIATNGTKSLHRYTPDRFLISVDGLEKQHDALRGQGAFALLMKNLSSTSLPKVALISLSQENVDQVLPILETFSEHLDGFWYSFVYDYRGQPQLALNRAQKQKVAKILLQAMSSFNIVNTRSFLKQVGIPRKCRPWMLTTVTADGRQHSGCMVEALESCVCELCDLPCHRELSDLLEPRFMWDHLKTSFKKSWLR